MSQITYDDYLAHYGVKGMKWGVRRSDEEIANAKADRAEKKTARQEKRAVKHDELAAKSEETINDLKANGVNSEYAKSNHGLGLKLSPKSHQRKVIAKDIEDVEKIRDTAISDAEKIRSGKMTSGQKKLAIGAAVAGTVLVAYGSYQFVNSGEYNRTKMKGASYLGKHDVGSWKKNEKNASKDLSADDIYNNIVSNINPDYGKYGSVMNCRRCTFAYEMSRRGYDVKATKTRDGYGQTSVGLFNATNPDGRIVGTNLLGTFGTVTREAFSGKGDKEDSLLSFISTSVENGNTGYGGVNIPIPKDKASRSSAIFSALGKQPDGARGEFSMFWETAGDIPGGGHSMAWEIVKGKPVIFDTQTGTKYDNPDKLNSVGSRIMSAGLTRLDNVDLNEDYLKRWVRNV